MSNFHSLEGVDRGSETQLQVSENSNEITWQVKVLTPLTFITWLSQIYFIFAVNGLYGSVFGFPTGIGYTIMMARVCQFYPNAPPAVLIQKFFILFANW